MIRALVQSSACALQYVCTESSLAVTTLDDSDVALRERVGNRILEFAEQHGQLIDHNAKGIDYIGVMTEVRSADQSTEEAGTRIFKTPPDYNGKIYELSMRDGFLKGGIEAAQREFWNDVRHSSSLLYHSSPFVEESFPHGLMSRNEQIRQFGDYVSATMSGERRRGVHHTNAPKFSEVQPAGEYIRIKPRSSGRSESEREGWHTPGTLGIPIGDVVRFAPYARNARFGNVAVSDQGRERIMNHMPRNTYGLSPRIGEGQPEHIGLPSWRSVQRVFLATPTEKDGSIPDNYAIPVTGIDSNGLPASSTRILFEYPHVVEASGMSQGHQFPRVFELGKDRGSNASVVAEAQAYIRQQNPHYENTFAVPLRRGVFDYLPEESNPYDYPYADRSPRYMRVESPVSV